MSDKLLRVSEGAWRKLRKAAFEKETNMKNIFDEIMSGELDPLTMKPKENNTRNLL